MERDPSQPELRQDIVTEDWIILAAGRAKRPHEIAGPKKERKPSPIEDCPFEALRPQGKSFLAYFEEGEGEDWVVQIIPNKYPLLKHKNVCSAELPYGPYKYATGVGHHDVVITRDHTTNFPHLDKNHAFLVFRSFQERYHQLAQDGCVNYFFALHNWGSKAGASIFHPHYQIVGMPVIPPDVHRSLQGSHKYFKENGKCPHCVMIEWEREKEHRIVFENEHAVSFVPYAARFPFEMRVFPKKHLPYFEDSNEEVLRGVTDILQKTLLALEQKVNDPDYNFYIHTAPMVNKEMYEHYHWHVEVLPKITTIASLEIGTGVEVNIIHPGEAAKHLREE